MDIPYLYPFTVEWRAEDDTYIATAPDLPGCSAFGASVAEVKHEIVDAIRAWIEACEAAGNTVPPPSRR